MNICMYIYIYKALRLRLWKRKLQYYLAKQKKTIWDLKIMQTKASYNYFLLFVIVSHIYALQYDNT